MNNNQADDEILQGSDALLSFTLPVDYTVYENIMVDVFDFNRRVITRASAKEITGYDHTLVKPDPENSKKGFVQVLAAHTENAQPGKYWAQVHTKLADQNWKTLLFNDKSYTYVFTIVRQAQKPNGTGS